MSAHPLATAITAYAQEHGYGGTARPESFENLSGRGLKAVLGGETVLAGNRRLLEEHGVDVSSLASDAERLSAQGQTPMYFARGGTLLGLISVADPVKETSAAAIQKMRGQGIRTVLLTGDNRAAAEHIGSLVGVDEVIAEVLPEEKAGVVERDEKEQGERKLLNLGHTVGHAIEKCSGYVIPHGHAVAAGLAVIARAAEALGWTEESLAARITACLSKNGLPTGTDYSAEALAEAALSDKKRAGGDITLVVPRKIGHCELRKVPVADLLPIIRAGLEA